MTNSNFVSEEIRVKYGIVDWASTAANVDGLFSNGHRDAYLDALSMAFEMGSNTKIVTTAPRERVVVVIYVLKFGSKIAMDNFQEDYEYR